MGVNGLEKPLFLLFDGHALVHRAFHALPPLTASKTGEPTGAVYGFTRMLLKALSDFRPTHWAIAFDLPTPTFRHLQFEAYKAQRPKAPDELVMQFKQVRQLVEAFHVPIFEVDGYEADDVLGTLSLQASNQGIDAIIVTGDADAMQLVSSKVRVLVPQKTFGEITLYNEAAVQQRYGVTPKQIPDLKGLKGDPSDNVPGLSGVGEKTAAKLVQQFGSIEGIYEHIDEVTPPKLRESLLSEEEKARQSKRLTTIVRDVPITLELASCKVSGYERDRVVELFHELEFFTLLDKLPEIEQQLIAQEPAQAKTPSTMRGEYSSVDTLPEIEELVSELHGTSSLALRLVTEDAKLVGIALSPAPSKAFYLPLGHKEQPQQLSFPQALQLLKPLLEDSHIPKVAHGGKEGIAALAKFGIELHNLDFDTMLAAYLLGEKSLEIKTLAFSKLGLEVTPLSALIDPKRAPAAEMSIPLATKYAGAEVDIISRLRPLLEKELKGKGLWQLFTEVEIPLVPVLALMERHGVALDTKLLRSLSQSLREQLRRLEEEIYQNAGHELNINSPQQLGVVLFKELKLPGAKKTKTGYSTDASVLEGLNGFPIVRLVLEYRQLMKLKSTYIDALPVLINPETHRVHTTFNQVGTTTGRLSSSEPNLQNIPIRGELGKQVRQAFIAEPPSLLIGGDYSQVELRILAHLSQDLRLLASFSQDEDIHATTASEVFGVALDEVTPEMRRVAKVVNFGVIYGMSEYGLEQATELSREEAAQFIDSYFQRYPRVKEYIELTKQQAREQGYVQTLMGRRRYIPEINSSNRQVREAAERMAINMPVQGTAADIIKLAMIRLQREIDKRGLKSRMLLQVHDELLFEVPPKEVEETKGLVEEIMPQAVELSVPLKVEVRVGRNWGEME